MDESPHNFERRTDNRLRVYKKWQGIHWILTDLADIGYPPGDESLIPSRDFEMLWLFNNGGI